MFKGSIVAAVVLSLAVGMMTSCIFDPKETKNPERVKEPAVYKDLSQQDDVLYNLELAYNERNIKEYARLLDSNELPKPSFTFIFSLADFASGATPDQWGRQQELNATGNMFNPNYSGDNRIVGINLTLQYPAENWTEITPPNPVVPGEKWYTKTVTYNMSIDALPDITFLSTDIKAEFTIRQTQLDGKDVWRIIVWRDQVEN